MVLDGSASADPDARPAPLRVAWRLVSRPEGSELTTAAIRDAATPAGVVTPDIDGDYLFEIEATDGEAVRTDQVLVRVKHALSERRAASAEAPPASATTAVVAPPTRGGTTALARDAYFEVSLRPAALTMTAGESARVDVFVAGRGLYGSSATADAPEVPSPVSATFARSTLGPGQGTGLTLRTPASMQPGAYRIVVTATARINGVLVRRDAVLTLQVRPRVGAPPPTQVTCSGANVAGLASTVYVSPQGNDGPGCGASSSAACATIQRGIDTCSSPGCSVLVRYGLYTTSATITLRDGVSVHGSCAFGDGASTAYRTVIAANPAPGTPAIAATSINSPTTVSGLVVVGKEETEAGTASIAMAIASSKGLVLTQSVLASGRGGDGTPGDSAAAAGGPGGAESGRRQRWLWRAELSG